jgi:superfamily II DNA or RNA helicase
MPEERFAMPRIFDNIQLQLVDGLRQVMDEAVACAFCVGYLNLRGWDQIADYVDRLAGGQEARACRLLVGMHRPPEEEMKLLYRVSREPSMLDGAARRALLQRFVQSFKEQIEFGAPTDAAERTLRQIARHLRQRKLYVKAFLKHPLHAKLYLVERGDNITPLIGFVGSSNLTLAGLSQQGELNVDVVEQDAAQKLLQWFNDRWNDPSAIDLSDLLTEIIETSWAREELVRPYLVYLKMAYHLCEEARQGERAFKMPKLFEGVLLDFQAAAVSLAVHTLYRRGGALLGDVVGLGKTLMATAVARILQEDADVNTLVICPPNLVPMWEWHLQQYQIMGRVLSFGKAISELPKMPRYRLLIIDESHNLRNREGKRYRAIRDYIDLNEPYVLLLTATPYNKEYADLANQIRLIVDEDADLKIRPERFFQQWVAQNKNDADFIATYRALPTSLRAFEQSPFPDDWRDLMRLFLVRRTRQFIMRHYAHYDTEKQRYYVKLNGQPKYFPIRQPKRARIETRPDDPYTRLFSTQVVAVIESLTLPRYGLANYLRPDAEQSASEPQQRVLENLTRAGRRLIGFCRTNLFKRLESCGYSFLLSVERHIVRNLVTMYALENGLPVPIGVQDAALLDTAISDADTEFLPDADEETDAPPQELAPRLRTLDDYRACAERTYQQYQANQRRFHWLPAHFFTPDLKQHLLADAQALLGILHMAGEWDPSADAKLDALYDLLVNQHPADKALVFTQFADTALYLREQLEARGVDALAVAISGGEDPYTLARRFSPRSNNGLPPNQTELRVLIATDVLSEGQNLQDAHIVVNYDLPWAIIRLIQRAGRVDRIGQTSDTILVYSFFPADGVESIIGLRERLVQRLQANREILGTDEVFFDEEVDATGASHFQRLRDLYTEKAGALDDDSADEDIDLSSLALQVWNSASEADQKAARDLPNVVYATRTLSPVGAQGGASLHSVITYLRFPDGTDTLVQVDARGNLVSQSLSAVFRTAACAPDTPPLPRAQNHHELVARCAEIIRQEQATLGGQLGALRSLRRKLYERLQHYREQLKKQPNLFAATQLPTLERVIDLLYRYPLKSAAEDALRRQLKLGIDDESLLEMLARMADDDRLCAVTAPTDETPPEPQIVCSMGFVSG